MSTAPRRPYDPTDGPPVGQDSPFSHPDTHKLVNPTNFDEFR